MPRVDNVQRTAVPAYTMRMLQRDLWVPTPSAENGRHVVRPRIVFANGPVKIVSDIDVTFWITAYVLRRSELSLQRLTVAKPFLSRASYRMNGPVRTDDTK